jgi:hypothetical protein
MELVLQEQVGYLIIGKRFLVANVSKVTEDALELRAVGYEIIPTSWLLSVRSRVLTVCAMRSDYSSNAAVLPCPAAT